MFKWKIISRTNVNGKVHTFQKDFDDYEAYQEFLWSHPEYQSHIEDWNPWRLWDQFLDLGESSQKVLPADIKYLPEGVDLTKYEQRREEKRLKARENAYKKHSLETSKTYLDNYLVENPDDKEAKSDLETIEKELSLFS